MSGSGCRGNCVANRESGQVSGYPLELLPVVFIRLGEFSHQLLDDLHDVEPVKGKVVERCCQGLVAGQFGAGEWGPGGSRVVVERSSVDAPRALLPRLRLVSDSGGGHPFTLS